jgi:hypothetical protein
LGEALNARGGRGDEVADRVDRLDPSERESHVRDAGRIDERLRRQIVGCRELVGEMDVVQVDQQLIPGGTGGRRVELVHDVGPGRRRAPVASTVGNEEYVARVEEGRRHVGQRPGQLFAAVVPDHRGKRTVSVGLPQPALQLDAAVGEIDQLLDRGLRGAAKGKRNQQGGQRDPQNHSNSRHG